MAPCPGNTTLSDRKITSGSLVIIDLVCGDINLKALRTDFKLPIP
jgi:hypothetical protein